MLRGHNPSLICAVITISSVLFLSNIYESLILLFITAIALYIIGIIFLFSSKLKKYSFIILIFALGFTFGAVCNLNIYLQKEKSFTGIAINRVTQFSGEIIEDSYISNKGISIHKLKLYYVSNEQGGITAEAMGNVIIFDDVERAFYTGEIINIDGILYENNSDIYFPFNGKINNINPSGFSSEFLSFRAEIRKRIEAQIELFGYPYSSIFKGLFLGLKNTIPEKLYNNFQETGTLHLLAISGLHVGIIYLFVILILYPIPWNSVKWILGSIIILFYMFIVGPKPSLIRASIMLILLGFSKLIDREIDPINILSLSLIIFLLIDPFSAFSLSFQLSFLAITGILISGRPISRFLSRYLPKFLNIPLSYSIGAQIFTLPVVLSQFGIFYPIGILTTILIVPFITVFLWAGIICLILVNLAAVLYPFKLLFMFLYYIISSITGILSIFPGIHIEWYISCILLVIILIIVYKKSKYENKL